MNMDDVHDFCEAQRANGVGYAACNKCPIHAACTSGTGYLTQASLDAWQERCVAALEKAVAA
ncbi:TPA: hypothetical protein ACGCNR_001535 [Stenotrophomonas maltophilia]